MTNFGRKTVDLVLKQIPRLQACKTFDLRRDDKEEVIDHDQFLEPGKPIDLVGNLRQT
jgi:hypothetical protein